MKINKQRLARIIISIPYIIILICLLPIIIILYPIILITNLWEAIVNYAEYGYWKFDKF